jgi:methanogenic corrinoid protein MtbC1
MDKAISNNIKELRKLNKYTQKQLASILGVAQTTIANYEKGIRVPDAEMLHKIADIFNVSIDYLIGRKKVVNFNIDEVEKNHTIYLNYLLKGDNKDAQHYINHLVDNGMDIEKIYFNIFEKTLIEVGLLWETGKIDIWKEHFISEIILDTMKEVKSKVERLENMPYCIIGITAGPELHNIGIKMILDLLDLRGFSTIYLGSILPIYSLIDAIKVNKPDMIIISVTMWQYVESARLVIKAVKEAFPENTLKIVVGGAAFKDNPNLGISIGADKYCLTLKDILEILK